MSEMEKPNLSIILPVHNEVDSLERVVSEWIFPPEEPVGLWQSRSVSRAAKVIVVDGLKSLT